MNMSNWPSDELAIALKEHKRKLKLKKEIRMISPENEFFMQFFEYNHLPPHLQDISKRFGELAEYVVRELPRNPERTVALRKLLESKDCAVRTVVAK